MRSILPALLLLASLGSIVATTPIGEYGKLWNLCEEGGSNVYVGVKYKDGVYETFSYGQCYPYEIDGNQAEMAVFCKSVTCYDNPNSDCTGGAVPPVGVPIPAGFSLINAADWVQLLGQGATCQPNGIPV